MTYSCSETCFFFGDYHSCLTLESAEEYLQHFLAWLANGNQSSIVLALYFHSVNGDQTNPCVNLITIDSVKVVDHLPVFLILLQNVISHGFFQLELVLLVCCQLPLTFPISVLGDYSYYFTKA